MLLEAKLKCDGVCEDEKHGHVLWRRVGGGGGGGCLPALTQHSSSMKDYSCCPCFRQPFLLCNHGDVTFHHGFIGLRVCICIFWPQQHTLRHTPTPTCLRSLASFLLSSPTAQDDPGNKAHTCFWTHLKNKPWSLSLSLSWTHSQIQ